MNIKERKKMSLDYFTRGKYLINDSQDLRKNKENVESSNLLLYFGIELLLKSYLIINHKDITINKLSSHYGHNLKLLLKDSKDFDKLNTISNIDFIELIDWLTDYYYSDFTELRYSSSKKHRIFPIMTFDVLLSNLIAPMGYYIEKFTKT